MTRFLTTLFLSLIFTFLDAHGQSWQWATSAGGQNANDGGGSVIADVNGNVYVTGTFGSSTITFGSMTLINAGVSSDIFIVKYDNGGNVIWAKRAGGSLNDVSCGITADSNGNVYITGWFESPSVVFDNFTLINTTPGLADIFIVKYDANGNTIWANNPSGTFVDMSYSVSTDLSNNLYVTGSFSTSITFDSITLTHVGAADVFIVKYNSNGNVLWAKSAGGTNTDIGLSVTNDPNNNAIITGFFHSSNITFGNTTLTNNGSTNSRNTFVTKYDANGNVLWANSPNGSAEGHSVATDINNNYYVAGTIYSDTIIFGSTILINKGFDNIFLAKYDSNGNVIWAKIAGGKSVDHGFSVATNNSYVFVAGEFISDTITFGTSTLLTSGSGDIFVLQYDSNGVEGWIKTVGGLSNEYATGITVAPNSIVYITGTFYSDTISFGNTMLNNGGQYDFFLANLNGLVGLEENISKDSFTIFPNPFSVQTVLHSGNYFQNAILTVANSLGQTVMKIDNINGDIIIFNRNNLLKGMYFLHLTQDNKIITTNKIIITD